MKNSKNHKYNIAILLPTRGRTDALNRSIVSLVNRALDKDKIQLLLAFDNDDNIGYDYFEKEIVPYLESKGVDYEAFEFDSLGYEGLNQYYNSLAKNADADWFFIWNDDAIMESTGWDRTIASHTGNFKLLAVRTHRDHPYSIFPIIPTEWHDVMGYLSRHQMIDAEVSHIAYMLDIFERIPVYVTHDRFDLTGNNLDETEINRVRFEGNPDNPLDYSNIHNVQGRVKDAEFLSKYLQSKDMDMSWWENVKTGKQDPWEKLAANDPNGQTVRTSK
jgi:hypothetical protein